MAFALLWAIAIFVTGVANLIWPTYGHGFLQMMASLYPGYKATASFGQVIVGTIYGLVDAAISAAIFAWLYNQFVPGDQKAEIP
jgi:hypothetical protein